MAEIVPGVYRHFKGGVYRVLGTATHSETGEEMVVYKALYDEHKIWVRPASMWYDTVTAADGAQTTRFVREEA